jgi:hypothetical protein
LESVLESEEGSAREAALKAAHHLGISDDDPVWVVVQVAEGDSVAQLRVSSAILMVPLFWYPLSNHDKTSFVTT